MIRLLWFLVKLGLVVGVAIWVADRSGHVTIEWKDKVVETSTLMLALAVGFIALLSYYLARFVSTLLTVPYRVRMYRHLQQQRKGERMLGQAVSALADEKKQKAMSFLHRAEKLLGHSQAVELVRSQTGEVPVIADQGNYSSPFAWKEAIENHLESGRTTEAKRLAESFATKHPRLALPKRLLFDVYAREQNWDLALRMLDILREEGAMPRSEMRNYRAAILTERARLALDKGQGEEAFEYARHADRLRPKWTPSILLAAKGLAHNKPREAANLIEKSWGDVAHPQLGRAWLALKTGKNDARKAQDAETMAKRAPNSTASKLLVVEALLRAGLLAQARFKAMEFSKDHPSREMFGLLAKIEVADHQPLAAQEWQIKAAEAPLGEAWVCDTCRQPHQHWQALCKTCRSFNALNWQAQPTLVTSQ